MQMNLYLPPSQQQAAVGTSSSCTPLLLLLPHYSLISRVAFTAGLWNLSSKVPNFELGFCFLGASGLVYT